MRENPFVFGKVVRGEHFCNRESELEQLKSLIQSKQHVVIISPRRYGKTSLIINALERNRLPHVYVDCSMIEDESGLVSALVNEYAKKMDSVAMLEKFLKRFNVSFSITINPVSVGISAIRSDSLKSVLTEIGRNYTIVFDEFQDLYENGGGLVKKVRSAVQFLERSAVMLGSRRHLLNKLFLKPRGIFYNFGYVLHLEKIEREKFAKFILQLFGKNDVEINAKEIDAVLDFTEGHSFFTQYLCYVLFEKKLAGKADVRQVLDEILNRNSAFYEETHLSLPGNQRKALLLLASGEKKIYSVEVLKKFHIASSQAMQKALKLLMKKELVDRNGGYRIVDVFFRHWLYQRV